MKLNVFKKQQKNTFNIGEFSNKYTVVTARI